MSREHRRAKTDRLDTKGLKRVFLGWLRGEREHCKMVAIPTLAEEDAKCPHRKRETLVGEQTTIINRVKATLMRLGIRNFNPKLKKAPERLEHVRTPEGESIPPNTLAELHRDMERRCCHATCAIGAPWLATGGSPVRLMKAERNAGKKGSRDPSNARVRRGMIQLAWRFIEFQKDSALAKWFQARTENARGSRKKTIVALARKLLIALWHFVRGCPRVSFCVLRTEGRTRSRTPNGSALSTSVMGLPMTVRGGGVPHAAMAFMPSFRMGPPPRTPHVFASTFF